MREALFALDLMGVIEVRHGDGTYVSQGLRGLRESEHFRYGAQTEHVIDTRIVVEPRISGELALDSDGIHDALQSLEAAGKIIDDEARLPEFTRLALQFHLDLAAAINNRLLGELAHEVISIDKQPVWALVNQLALKDPQHRYTVQQEHSRVMREIQTGDADKSFSAMKEHLENNKQRILPPDETRQPTKRKAD